MSAKQKRPHRAAWLTRATGQDAGAGANPPVYWHYTTVPVLPVPLAAWATIETWDEGRWLTDPDWPPLQAAAKAGDHTGVRAVVRAKACAALTYTTMPPIHHAIVTALLDQNRALATFLGAPRG